MTNQHNSEEKAKNAAIKAGAKAIAIGTVATLVFGSPVGWGLTAYYAWKYAKEAYQDPSNRS